jgi:hypothetical protein
MADLKYLKNRKTIRRDIKGPTRNESEPILNHLYLYLYHYIYMLYIMGELSIAMFDSWKVTNKW